jgi:hypothetical protein
MDSKSNEEEVPLRERELHGDAAKETSDAKETNAHDTGAKTSESPREPDGEVSEVEEKDSG